MGQNLKIAQQKEQFLWNLVPIAIVALESKIRVHFQNKIPFQRMKTLKTVSCT
jgi:hypothetical protein